MYIYARIYKYPKKAYLKSTTPFYLLRPIHWLRVRRVENASGPGLFRVSSLMAVATLLGYADQVGLSEN